jgi:DNA-binding NarL/FixJ family response regulator
VSTQIVTTTPRTEPRPPLRILICDDHEVVREGLRTLLAGRADMEVAAEAATSADAIEAAARERPDIVIMDVRLPDGSGVEACRAIREILPATRVIMLTSYPDDEALYASIVAGASGYLLKQTRAAALIDAIDAVSKGRALLDPDVTARVLERVRRGNVDEDPALASLTDQERRVLEQIATGKTNREIGEVLFLSEKTVKNYVSRILEKLGLHRRAEAAAFAARRSVAHEHE